MISLRCFSPSSVHCAGLRFQSADTFLQHGTAVPDANAYWEINPPMLTLTKPGIEEYAQDRSGPVHPVLKELEKETYETMKIPQMLCGPLEGTFLKLMVQVTGAKRVLEIGMFTGYSALSMAEGLPADGKLTTLEISPECVAVAKRYFQKSEHGKKIQVIEGPALDSLKGLEGPFDLVFIDADKTNYNNYYDAVLPKMSKGGTILVDNVLYGGDVLEPKEENSRAIAEFNEKIAKDARVEKALLTIRDGVYFIRVK